MVNFNHQGIKILEETVTPKLEELKTLARVNESDIQILENGLKFSFGNSLKANFCRVMKYHDNLVIEFRKQNEYGDKLIYESVIKPQEFTETFEKVTGIYLSYLKD